MRRRKQRYGCLVWPKQVCIERNQPLYQHTEDAVAEAESNLYSHTTAALDDEEFWRYPEFGECLPEDDAQGEDDEVASLASSVIDGNHFGKTLREHWEQEDYTKCGVSVSEETGEDLGQEDSQDVRSHTEGLDGEDFDSDQDEDISE